MTLTALVQTIFIGLASADFWLYHTIKHVPNWQAMDSYQIWDDNPACDQVWTQVDYDYSPDVSGDKTGIRCVSYEGFEGCGFDADAKDIDVIEMNFHGVEPIYHWTYPFVGVDGIVYGSCDPVEEDAPDFSCQSDEGIQLAGKRKFHCFGQNGHVVPSAAEINEKAAADNDPLRSSRNIY